MDLGDPESISRRGRDSATVVRLQAELDALVDEVAHLTKKVERRQNLLNDFERRYRDTVGQAMSRVAALEGRALLPERKGMPASAMVDEDRDPPVVDQRLHHDRDRLRWAGAHRSDFRALARQVHPDLACDEDDRCRRSVLMARLNTAWESGDIAGVARIDREVRESGLTHRDGSNVERESTLQRWCDDVQAQLRELGVRLRSIEGSALEQLRMRSLAAAKDGRDLLLELAAQWTERERAFQPAAERGD